jgi:hypothetical protein
MAAPLHSAIYTGGKPWLMGFSMGGRSEKIHGRIVSVNCVSSRDNPFKVREKAKNYPGSFSKWWTPATSGMYITRDLSQKFKETPFDKR